MKIGRIICAVVMVLLCVFGWFSQVSTFLSKKNQWQTNVEDGQEYEARGLHQRAIQSYEAALSVREDEELRRELLDVYALAWEEREVTRSEYRSALEIACAAWPKKEDFWVRLVEVLRDSNSYPDAYKALAQAGRAGAKGGLLEALNREITYAFTSGSQYFTRYYSAPSGYTTIYSGERWGVIAPDGEREYDCEYQYISPYSDDGSAVFCTEEDARLLDKYNILQAVLEEEPIEARAYGDGFLPTLQNNKWSYLDCEKGVLVGEYDNASSYQGGSAAVCRGEGWSIINSSGDLVIEQEFSDLRLYGNGNYSYDSMFVAAVNGDWSLYQDDGTAVSTDFIAKDMDLYFGEAVAFQDTSGLWGFMDRKGKIIIEPQFQQAKSFSGGLAAVSNGDQWGFIDLKGEIVVDFQFLDVGYFTKEGACPISTVDGEFHMIILRFPGGE